MQDYFHVPESYFLSHSVGCLPRQADHALQDNFLAPWVSGQNWADWMPIFDRFRDGVAQIIGAKASEICPQNNISSALTKILFSLPFSASKPVIVLSKQDFPTIGFVLKQAERQGYTLRFIDGDPTDITQWERAIDDRVACVHVTHALSNTSHRLPVTDICTLARHNDAISIVDTAQSVGAVPIDVKTWGADFTLGTGVKFLCFGPGACFLYARTERLSECNPIDVGWFSHENPFEMDIMHFKLAQDALRFFGGTPSPAPFVMANAAMALWTTLNFDKIHAHIQNQLEVLVAATPERYLVSPSAKEQRGATLVVNPSDRSPLRHALKTASILHDERKEGFRCSVHGYTSETDTARLANILSETL